MIRAAGLGQVLALLNVLTGVTSTALVKKGVSLPATQSLLNYICLALVYGGCLVIKQQKVREAWWKYACLSLSECLATICLVTAYRFTSLTSVTLLDCFSIPCVLLLSQIFLKARYTGGHWLGSGVCFLGLVILVVTDHSLTEDPATSDPAGGSSYRPVLGDSLVVLGSILYGINNVAQESLLGSAGKLEVLAMGGLFGTVFGGCVAFSTEWDKILTTHWTGQVVGLTIGFDAACFAFTSLVPFALLWGGATLFNLSLLASDVWAVLARIVFFDGFSLRAGLAFSLAFLLVACGVILYTLSGDPTFAAEDESASPMPAKADVEQPDSSSDRAASTRDTSNERATSSRDASNDSLELQDLESRRLLNRDADPAIDAHRLRRKQ